MPAEPETIAPCPLNRKSSPSGREPSGQIVCELCRILCGRGWLNAVGGGISILCGNKIYFGPVGTELDRQCPLQLFMLHVNGALQQVAECDIYYLENINIMMMPHKLLSAEAVIHTHSQNSMMATWLFGKEFVFARRQIDKLFPNNSKLTDVRIPIIDNSNNESELSRAFEEQLLLRPKSQAVLVRGHGIYVWSENWIKAKQLVEYYELLFDAAIQTKRSNL